MLSETLNSLDLQHTKLRVTRQIAKGIRNRSTRSDAVEMDAEVRSLLGELTQLISKTQAEAITIDVGRDVDTLGLTLYVFNQAQFDNIITALSSATKVQNERYMRTIINLAKGHNMRCATAPNKLLPDWAVRMFENNFKDIYINKP